MRFTMNAYQDGYSDYGVDIDAETFEEIMATRRKVTDAKEPAASLANLAETLQAAEDDVDRQAEESIRVDVDGLRKEFARLSETEGARLQALLGVWDGTETGAEMLLSEVEFHTVLAVLKDMRRGKKILSVLATPRSCAGGFTGSPPSPGDSAVTRCNRGPDTILRTFYGWMATATKYGARNRFTSA